MTQSEYATMMFYWFYEPHYERADEILATFDKSGWARTPQRVLPMSCTVLALAEYFRRQGMPDKERVWRQNHPDLFALIDRSLKANKEVWYWADGLIAMWIILRDDRYLEELRERTQTCEYAQRALEQMREHHSPFRKALEKLEKGVPVTVN